MDEDNNIGANLEQPEYLPDVQPAPVFDMAPTGEQMDLSFLNEPYNPSWPDAKKLQWEKRWVANISTTPAAAAKETSEMMRKEREMEAAAKTDPSKKMTSAEVNDLTQLASVGYSLDLLEQKLKEVPENERGPLFGKVRGANPYDVQAQEIKNIISSIVPGLARGVFMEVGVLTPTDDARYTAMLPNLSSPPELARRDLMNLRDKLADSKMKTIETMRKAGMDVRGFEEDYGRLVQEREAKKQAAQQQQAQQQTQIPPLDMLLPVLPDGSVLKKPGDPDFDPTEDNGNPYYE
jgi:hypothetical protein